jgi:cell division protein FtsW (lipid II flippase)
MLASGVHCKARRDARLAALSGAWPAHYWLVFGQPDWASIVLWLVVVFWPLVLAWEVGWWLLKVALAVGLSLFLLAVGYDVWQRRRS